MTQRLFYTFGLGLMVSMLLSLQTFAAPEVDPIMGNWEGSYINNRGVGGTIRLQVISLGSGNFQAALYIDEGPRLEVPGKLIEGKAIFEGKVDQGAGGGGPADVRIQQYSDTQIIGSIRDVRRMKSIDMQKVEKKSPTLGARPPEGAIVLFDGTNLNQWQNLDKTPAQWKILGQSMEVAKTMRGARKNIISKDEFGDVKIHLEFRTPFMPEAKGQARGNSGVYVHGRYEVQVLDSFGLEGKDNECGGIYQIASPDSNACLPPLQWQTYDITFQAPRFGENGAKTQDAIITVEHNGILIQDHIKVPKVTQGGVNEQEAPLGGLLLQDHGDRVQYRNIWVVPM